MLLVKLYTLVLTAPNMYSKSALSALSMVFSHMAFCGLLLLDSFLTLIMYRSCCELVDTPTGELLHSALLGICATIVISSTFASLCNQCLLTRRSTEMQK